MIPTETCIPGIFVRGYHFVQPTATIKIIPKGMQPMPHIRMARPRIFRGCCHRGRASTRPYIACCTSTKYTGIISTKKYHRLHRVAVGASGSSPAHPHGAPTHIPGLLSPRASFHSPLHCILYINDIHRDYINDMHRGYIACCTSIKYGAGYINNIHHGLHRVAVGATGRSPATHAMRTCNLSPTGDNPCLAVG